MSLRTFMSMGALAGAVKLLKDDWVEMKRWIASWHTLAPLRFELAEDYIAFKVDGVAYRHSSINCDQVVFGEFVNICRGAPSEEP